MNLSFITLVIALGAFIFFCFKGLPPVVMSVLCATFVCIVNGMPITDTLLTVFMPAGGNYFSNYFLTFLSGACFGAVMADCGAARSIALVLANAARKFKGHEKMAALWCSPIIAFILSYGGISAFVAFFTIIAITKELFEEMDLPWSLYGVHMLGDGVMALTMCPGSPSVNNVIAGNILGTTAMSGAVLGLCAMLISIVFCMFYFNWELKRAEKRGEGFMPTGAGIKEVQFIDPNEVFVPINFLLALSPSIVLWVLYNFVGLKVWAATFFAILYCLVVFWNREKAKFWDSIKRGITQAATSIATLTMIIGFGAVVTATPGYEWLIGLLTSLGGNGYLQVVIAVNIGAGITGSSSGGMTIALNSLADRFLGPVEEGGLALNPHAVHRIACVSSGGLDSLPCCSVVINEITNARLTMAQAYRPFGVISVFMTVMVAIVLALLANMGIC